MALAIDPTTPALATGNQTATTASFTPPAGSLLLVAFSGNDDDWPQFPTVPTITDNLGSHLTYTIWDWQCGGDAGALAVSRPSTGHEGQTAFWTANVITSAAMTISVTNNTTLGQSQCAVRVWVLTGADAADPVGAHGFNGSTSSSTVSQSYTAQIDNGQGFLAVCDWAAVGTETAGAGCTLDDSGSLGAPDVSYGFTHRTVADDANGGLTTLNMSLPSSSTSLNWSYIEIQPGLSDPPEKDPPPFINFYAPGGLAPNGIPSPWVGTANAAPNPSGVIVHASSPATVLNTAGTATGLTTASFTPPANSLLLILWSGNSIDPTNPPTPTITDSLGVPLTYTLSDWQSRADSPTTDGQAAAWTAPVTASAAMTVTVNNNAASPNRHAALTVLVLTDPNGRPRVGAHGKSGSTSASIITQSYTAQATGGQGFFSVCDWNAVGTPTAGTGCYVALPSSTGPDGSAGTIPTQISFGHFKRTIPDDVNAVANRINVSLPATSTALNWVFVEILPALLVAPTVFTRHRIFPTYQRRGHTAAVVPAQVVVTPPAFIPAAIRPRPKPATLRRRSSGQVPADQAPAPQSRVRLKFPKPVRGHTAQPTPPQITVAPPAYPTQGLRTRIRFLRQARPQAVSPVPAQIIITPPAFIPTAIRPRIKPAALRRRTTGQTPTGQSSAPQTRRSTVKAAPARRRPTAVAPPEQPSVWQVIRARLKFPKPARGHNAQPTPPQIVVAPPTYPPQGLRTRIRFVRQARPQAVSPVPAQIIITPPAYVPQGLRARIRSLRLPRSRAATPVPAQVVLTAPAYPPQTGRPHPRLLRYFRGRATPPPQTAAIAPPAARARQLPARPVRRARPAIPLARQELPPLFARIKLRAIRLFRGKTRPVVPAQIILVPPPYPLQSVRGKKRLWSLRRRRAGMEGWLVGAAANPCVTPRPSTGTTGRPGSGTTAYLLATTARPSSGTTTRPNTGTTEDPC